MPGHSDYLGNCIADELAKSGTNLPNNHIWNGIGRTMATCKQELEDDIVKAANARWIAEVTCRTSKLSWHKYARDRSTDLLRLIRQNLRRTVSMITGHNLLGKHALNLGLTQIDFCRYCQDEEEEESSCHILCHCKALSSTICLSRHGIFYRTIGIGPCESRQTGSILQGHRPALKIMLGGN